MDKQLYTRSRQTINESEMFQTIKSEMIPLFESAKVLLDARFNASETYSYDANGFKVLAPECEPIRTLEVVRLILKNDIVVGQVTLRGSTNKPTYSSDLMQDVLVREYELRFKTFAGCDFTVESAGIAFSQRGKGPYLVNSGNVSGFNTMILKRHWDEFKDKCTFTATDLDAPVRLQKWAKRVDVLARA